MYMVMVVIDDRSRVRELLDAWVAIGVTGATIVPSTGLHRMRFRSLGARYAFGVPRRPDRVEQGHNTVFVVVADEDSVRQCLSVVEEVLGDLDEGHKGIFAAWPLTLCKGLAAHSDDDNGWGDA